jgi:hypothetical protein
LGNFFIFLKSPGQAQLPVEEVIVVIPHPNSVSHFFICKGGCSQKWQLPTGRFSKIWLQVKYGNNFFLLNNLSFFCATYLNHVLKSGDFFFIFGQNLDIENLQKKNTWHFFLALLAFNIAIWLLYIASQKKKQKPHPA